MDRDATVRRTLERYLVEVVEAYDLCPWARSARVNGEVGVEIVWGAPALDEWIAAARRALARPQTRVAMVVAPELAIAPSDLKALRDRVSTAIGNVGVAEFHPEAALDLATPPRLVRFLRRSPDPLLQLVPLSLLASVRSAPPVLDRAAQLKLLDGTAPTPRGDVADRIAVDNHVTVSAHHAAIVEILDAIADERRTAYARANIGTVPHVADADPTIVSGAIGSASP